MFMELLWKTYYHNITWRSTFGGKARLFRWVIKGWMPPPWSWMPPPDCRGTFNWALYCNGDVPAGAAVAGRDWDRGVIYVGRLYYRGDLLPAKVCPRHGCAFASYDGAEIQQSCYEVLVSTKVSWRVSGFGKVPPDALRVGQTVGGEPLYMGRMTYEGTITPGRVQPSHKCLYISWAGKELKFQEYELMVMH